MILPPPIEVTAHDALGNVLAVVVQKPTGLTQYGANLIFGVPQEYAGLPVINLPPGTISYRVRYRPKEYARVFVRTATATSMFYVSAPDHNLCLTLGPEVQRNERAKV